MHDAYAPPALFVTWRAPSSQATYPVGRLTRLATPERVYEYCYLAAAYDAARAGFVPFVSFPDLQRVYRSRRLPPFFQNRLMSPQRPEFKTELAELGLDATAEPEAILARTNGRRATDPYELFAEFEPSNAPGEWETRFFARSMRYLPNPADVDSLEPGQRLFCMVDLQNPVDARAIAFRTVQNAIVGCLPAYLVDELTPLFESESAVVVTVERVNPAPAPLQHRLRCHLRVRPRDDFHAYRKGRYEPMAAEAVRITPWGRATKVA